VIGRETSSTQGREPFNDGCGYSKPHGVHSPKQAAATGAAMKAFIERGGKVERLDPVKDKQSPGFKAVHGRR
jgi:hypothetical protein